MGERHPEDGQGEPRRRVARRRAPGLDARRSSPRVGRREHDARAPRARAGAGWADAAQEEKRSTDARYAISQADIGALGLQMQQGPRGVKRARAEDFL